MMQLEKWYGDVVIGDEVRIVYRARLTWGVLRVGYAAEMTPDGHFTHRWLSDGVPLPHTPDQGQRWVWPTSDTHSPALIWTPSAHARDVPELCLWQDPHTANGVWWQPVVCSGAVHGPLWARAGRGYVERLRLTLPPWGLGLRVLRWGRFCGLRHSMVWIEWQGRCPRQWVWVDAVVGHEVTVETHAVHTPNAVVTWTQPRTLMEERLSAGPLHHLSRGIRAIQRDPASKGFFAFLNATQHKYHAPAVWQGSDGEQEQGHVIYEEVLWS